MSFKIGDKVEAFGVEGVVTEIYASNPYSVLVDFGDFNEGCFTSDGRFFDWAKTPSLKLIEQPKKTKVFKEWITKDGDISDWLINDELIDFDGDCHGGDFLMWTGREFELEVKND